MLGGQRFTANICKASSGTSYNPEYIIKAQTRVAEVALPSVQCITTTFRLSPNKTQLFYVSFYKDSDRTC